MQASDHRQAQFSLAVQYFGNSATGAIEWLEVARRQVIADPCEI